MERIVRLGFFFFFFFQKSLVWHQTLCYQNLFVHIVEVKGEVFIGQMNRMSDTNGRKRGKEKVGLKPIENWNRNIKVSFQSVIVSYFYCKDGRPSVLSHVRSNILCVSLSPRSDLRTQFLLKTPSCGGPPKTLFLKFCSCMLTSVYLLWPENTIPIKNYLLWWSTKDFILKVLYLYVDVSSSPLSDPSPCS